MHALIVTVHPETTSLTHSIAARIAEGVSESGGENSFELADLAAEGFDPRFSEADLAVHRKQAPPPADVAAEQARIDRADALVLVYPVYWWSMPGLLKGWIDRVFANGWAYDEGPDTKLVKKLQRLKVHLVGIGGADAGTYGRHGYFDAMKTQIDHGIFDYCGACVATSELLLDSQAPNQSAHLETARAIGRNIFSAPEQCKVAEAA
jgi:NAD(P)H dehydrogenase (quinone)